MTPTDPIRDEAVKVLAEALWNLDNEMVSQVGWMHGGPEDRSVREVAEAFLDASPTLARRLALGTALDTVLAAPPDDDSFFFNLDRINDLRPWRWVAAISSESCDKTAEEPTPELALAALAAKLGSGK